MGTATEEIFICTWDLPIIGMISAAPPHPCPTTFSRWQECLGVDYMHGEEVGAFFQVQPGFYTQSDIGISSFDVPITLHRIFTVQEKKKFYVFGGAYSFLSPRRFHGAAACRHHFGLRPRHCPVSFRRRG